MTYWHYFSAECGSLAVYAGLNKQKCAQNKVAKFFNTRREISYPRAAM